MRAHSVLLKNIFDPFRIFCKVKSSEYDKDVIWILHENDIFN